MNVQTSLVTRESKILRINPPRKGPALAIVFAGWFDNVDKYQRRFYEPDARVNRYELSSAK